MVALTVLTIQVYAERNITHVNLQGSIEDNARIYGGIEVKSATMFPWMVLIRISDDPLVGYCGGSLLTMEWVMTAAHCIFDEDLNIDPDVEWIKVYAGIINRDDINDGNKKVEYDFLSKDEIDDYVFPHQSYAKQNEFDSDIALIKLKKGFTRTNEIDTIRRGTDTDFQDYDTVIASGWGTTGNTNPKAKILQYAELNVFKSLSWCQSIASSLHAAHKITDKMICHFTPGKNFCGCDSGSPLVIQKGTGYVQIGIVSFGPGTEYQELCESYHRGFFLNVAEFNHWIDITINGRLNAHGKGCSGCSCCSCWNRCPGGNACRGCNCWNNCG